SLENISYSLNTNCKYIDTNILIETVIEYFMYNESTDIQLYITILEKVDIGRKIKTDNFKKIISNFPSEKIKTNSDIRKVINRIYSVSKDNILDETPNILAWIRKGIVYSALAGNLYIGALAIFIDKFIETTVQRKDVSNMVKKLESEKKLIEKKLDKSISDKSIDKYKKYLKEIEDNLYKLKTYEDSLYSERELDKRGDNMSFENTTISIDTETYNEKCHNNLVSELNKIQKEYDILSKTTFKDLLNEKSIIVYSDEDIKYFEESLISEFVNTDNIIEYAIGDILPYNSNDIDQLKVKIESLCIMLNNIADDDIFIYHESLSQDISKIVVSTNISVNDIEEGNTNINIKRDMASILALEDVIKSISSYDVNNIIEECVASDIDIINYITEFSIKHPLVIDNNILTESLSNLKTKVYKEDSSYNKFKIGSIIESNIYELKNISYTDLNKNRFEILSEMYDINNRLEVLTELSVGNKLKMSKAMISNNIKKMSDKEKAMSRQMDNALDKFYNNVEKELTNKNREKVIKGSILPSASTIVKTAILSSAGFFISPALSVIGVLGAIAVSKNATHKEKQYILDEINIMLKLVDKKIQLAENNNDMKALEQLLRTQQQLEREKQRIQYNLRRRNYPVYK
ncbi:MAG: hypothetical protein ACRCXT_18935, partial [Paraclostridium sp.]